MELRKLQHDELIKVADAAAATSIAGFAISWAHAGEVVTVVAGAVAILAGLAASWFHIEGALARRRDRRSKK